MREVFFISNILQFEMVHFIGQLQYYIHFEIIESSSGFFSETVVNEVVQLALACSWTSSLVLLASFDFLP